MAYKEILTEISDSILTITLNRPEKLNAFTGTMMREMIDAFDRADADDDVRCDHRHRRGPRLLRRRRLSAGGGDVRLHAARRPAERNAGSVDDPASTGRTSACATAAGA